MVDKTALVSQVRQVARAREQAQKLADEKAVKLKAWEAENEIFLEAVKEAAKYRDEQENQLRELTLLVYQETGEKKPCEGVNVKIFQKLLYNQEEAKDWCLEHRVALKLDAPVFEKLAQAEKLPFVTTTEEPRAQIATDLSEIIKLEVK